MFGTNEFLNKMQAEGKIEYLVSDIPKSFILMKDGTVFVVELSSQKRKNSFSKQHLWFLLEKSTLRETG